MGMPPSAWQTWWSIFQRERIPVPSSRWWVGVFWWSDDAHSNKWEVEPGGSSEPLYCMVDRPTFLDHLRWSGRGPLIGGEKRRAGLPCSAPLRLPRREFEAVFALRLSGRVRAAGMTSQIVRLLAFRGAEAER